jgi:hypothetical protein
MLFIIEKESVLSLTCVLFFSSPNRPSASGVTSDVWSGVDVTPSDVREHGVRCACGIGVDSGLMVHCSFCKQWQHGVSVIFIICLCSLKSTF